MFFIVYCMIIYLASHHVFAFSIGNLPVLALVIVNLAKHIATDKNRLCQLGGYDTQQTSFITNCNFNSLFCWRTRYDECISVM